MCEEIEEKNTESGGRGGDNMRRRSSREHKFTLNLLLLHLSVNFTLLCVFVQTPGGAAIDRPPYYSEGDAAGGARGVERRSAGFKWDSRPSQVKGVSAAGFGL